MQFMVLGYDGTDEDALDRRMAARESHLAQAARWHAEGRWLYAAAILNDAGKMAGSMIICDFDSKEALEEQWLKNEPYVLGKVWERIDICRAQVAPFCAPEQKQGKA